MNLRYKVGDKVKISDTGNTGVVIGIKKIKIIKNKDHDPDDPTNILELLDWHYLISPDSGDINLILSDSELE